MSEEELVVDDVEIVKAPGFDTGGFPVDDLSPGINLVCGPNASGKTTLATSLQWLLWPQVVRERVEVVGHLSLNGDEWRVRVNDRQATYQQNGQEANRPSLPSDDQRDRYHLSLHDLLQHETRNETFAQAIHQESIGGYDLSEVEDRLKLDNSPSTRGKTVVQNAESAVGTWREAQEGVESLRDEERRLPRLRAQLEDTKRAKDRVKLLDQAIEYANARDILKETEKRLQEFPEELGQINGNEADAADDLEGRIDRWETKKEEFQQTQSKAKEQFEEADLSDGGLSRGFIDRLEERQERLKSLEETKQRHEANLTEYKKQRHDALENIPLETDEEYLIDLELVAWEDASKFVRQAEKVRANREAHDAVKRWLGNEQCLDDDLLTLRRGRKELEDWLTSSSPNPTDSDEALTVALVSGVLLTMASAALGFFVHPVLYLGILAAGGISWYGYRASNHSGESGDPRQPHRESFERLDLEPPNTWTSDSVRDSLLEIYDKIAERRLDDHREQKREALEKDVEELEGLEQELEEKRSAIRDRFGAAPDTFDIELLAFAIGVLQWQQAHRRVLGLRTKIEHVEGQFRNVRSVLDEELSPYGYGAVTESADAAEYIRKLDTRREEHDDATRDLKSSMKTIEEAEESLVDLKSQRDEIFTSIDLEPDEYERLRDLCDRAEEYQRVHADVEKNRGIVERETQKLEECPGHEPGLKARSVPALEQDKRDAEEDAEKYDEIRDVIKEIETKLEQAREDNAVETALAEKQRALDKLYNQYEQDCAAMVGHVLVEHVRKATSDVGRPKVFKQARAIFARITRGQYRLDLDDEGTTFRAYDTIKETGFALDELSSATRLQLLLAVRIAFVEQQEQNLCLPLILDETLANSDDLKADVIIESMIELAREGRQIFYFTAQGNEISKWLAALEDVKDIDYTTVDLAEVQGLEDRVHVPDLDTVVETSSPPRPDDHDHASYGEALGVPPFDLRQGAGSVHLWYLIDDTELLHHLLEVGVERWGPLKNLLERTDSTIISDDPNVLEAIDCNGKALEELVRSWRKGRGKQVGREVLEGSEAVSGNFIDEVTELAKSVNGDAKQIVKALRNGEVDRFRRGKTDELEEFFEHHGYIESINPLEPTEIRFRVIECYVLVGVTREEAIERADELLARVATM